ncbi:hypothetical protein [Ruegeria jejuensis]|uniref:hypothetical protein n=1 Tax=Ruegeria jejuensis TaxID=3233338 RepID=UPI00355C7D0B
MKKLSLAAIGVIAVCGAANAGEKIYDCELSSNEKYGWIPDQMIFLVNEDDQSVTVADPIIHNTVGGPISATVRSVKDGKYKLKWTLRNLKARRGSLTGNYQATLDTTKGYVRARANLSGLDNRPSGQGACKISNAK